MLYTEEINLWVEYYSTYKCQCCAKLGSYLIKRVRKRTTLVGKFEIVGLDILNCCMYYNRSIFHAIISLRGTDFSPEFNPFSR